MGMEYREQGQTFGKEIFDLFIPTVARFVPGPSNVWIRSTTHLCSRIYDTLSIQPGCIDLFDLIVRQ